MSHVDDFVFGGTDNWNKNVIDRLLSAFNISKHAQGSFKYTGLNVIQTVDHVKIDQNYYVSSLVPIKITQERAFQKDDELTLDERADIRSFGGQMLWVTTQTCPDAAYDACWVANYGKHPTIRQILEANKALRKLQNNQMEILFPALGKPEDMQVIVYQDAAHANLPSGASQGGSIIFLSGASHVAPISWSSKKLSRVTKSPLASEAAALSDSADSGFLVAMMLREIVPLRETPPVKCYTDSKSLVDHIQTCKITQDSRLRVDIARLREMVQLGEVSVQWVDSSKQIADSLTKAGASSVRLRNVLQSGSLH